MGLTMARAGHQYGDEVSDVAIRPYVDADELEVLQLLAASLGKVVDDRYRGLFRWKHLANPFGRSCMWVAEREGGIVGFRSFLRWRFLDPAGDRVPAVRAVDTATHPDAQGLGIFTKLTMHALDQMREGGIQFVFNTPNDQSRPGYLKMGWIIEGRVPVQVRPRNPSSLVRMARARTPADTWSLPTTLGQAVSELDDAALDRPRAPKPSVLVTDRDAAFLRWRYSGCQPVASAAVDAGAGLVLLRFRHRGPAVECTVGDVVGPEDAGASGRAVRSAMVAGAADYAIASAASPIGGMVRIERLGPIQTRRTVTDGATTLPLELSLGDVELF
jgi:GNAT superfamily N-acetyltransferase